MDGICPSGADRLFSARERTLKNPMRVKLEPELEEQVCLMTASQRVALAFKFERWARQLRVSAFILRRVSSPKRPPSLKVLSRRSLLLN